MAKIKNGFKNLRSHITVSKYPYQPTTAGVESWSMEERTGNENAKMYYINFPFKTNILGNMV